MNEWELPKWHETVVALGVGSDLEPCWEFVQQWDFDSLSRLIVEFEGRAVDWDFVVVRLVSCGLVLGRPSGSNRIYSEGGCLRVRVSYSLKPKEEAR